MSCDLCKKRGKTWRGDDPKCAFENGVFSRDNWSCATIHALRDIVYEGQKLPSGIDYQYCDDQKYATIKVSELDLDGHPYALWISWYKNRGATDALWLLFDDFAPRRPMESEVLAIINHYKTKETK